VKDIKEGKN
jgi:hypothetical protein